VSAALPLYLSPLNHLHQRLGARFAEFAGWSLPVQYRGTLAEHSAVRSAVGVFDISHLGRLSVQGPGATALLQRLFCNDAGHSPAGHAQYTLMLTPAGGVIDDLIVWRWDEEGYWVLPNAANYDSVLEIMGRSASASVVVRPLRETTAMLAIQGPEAPQLLQDIIGCRPPRFSVVRTRWRGEDLNVAGTGYTGEPGSEIVASVPAAEALFEALVARGCVPCGLAARDTLRLEMGYPLWGQDLGLDTTPLEAGLGWAVYWDHDFVGRSALQEQRRRGLGKRLIAFSLPNRTIPRRGFRLQCGAGEGTVTSGNFSPTLATGIGMGYCSPDPGDATETSVEVRGRWEPALRVKPPFVRH
jgi:aminomethyltransferase